MSSIKQHTLQGNTEQIVYCFKMFRWQDYEIRQKDQNQLRIFIQSIIHSFATLFQEHCKDFQFGLTAIPHPGIGLPFLA